MRAAALATSDGEQSLQALGEALDQSAFSKTQRHELLAEAWEAVEGALEDGVLSLNEEAALVRYRHHFDLSVAAEARSAIRAIVLDFFS